MTKPSRAVLLALTLMLSTGQLAAAEVSEEELKSISTPDKVNTSLGELKFFDCVPNQCLSVGARHGSHFARPVELAA